MIDEADILSDQEFDEYLSSDYVCCADLIGDDVVVFGIKDEIITVILVGSIN
jgi:hypothetical protein